jgi:hypothetical protein
MDFRSVWTKSKRRVSQTRNLEKGPEKGLANEENVLTTENVHGAEIENEATVEKEASVEKEAEKEVRKTTLEAVTTREDVMETEGNVHSVERDGTIMTEEEVPTEVETMVGTMTDAENAVALWVEFSSSARHAVPVNTLTTDAQ